jgi:hypothetical protein
MSCFVVGTPSPDYISNVSAAELYLSVVTHSRICLTRCRRWRCNFVRSLIKELVAFYAFGDWPLERINSIGPST